jgi:hypothetical protein
MARPVSWLPRLNAVCRTVNDSVRSHYSSRDIERLFQLQPRSAQMLMSLMPTVQVGKSILIERESLAALLGRLVESSDPGAELAAMKAERRPPAVKRSLRELVQRDVAAGESALPANVNLERGSLKVQFATVEELAASLWRLAMLLEEDLDCFALLYEPEPEALESEVADNTTDIDDAIFLRDWLAKKA